MADPTFYLFDGYNVLHAGSFSDSRELVDQLASFVALRGARGVVVFDGAGDDHQLGPLSVRFAVDADTALERLAAEHRSRAQVLLVSSDRAIRDTAGQEVAHRSSNAFAGELTTAKAASRTVPRTGKTKIEDALDDETRARLEDWRRKTS